MRRLSAHLGVVTGLIVLAAAFGACAVGGGTSGGATGPTPTATPIPCATRATTTATVWNESDKQIHGGIGGAFSRRSPACVPKYRRGWAYMLKASAPSREDETLARETC